MPRPGKRSAIVPADEPATAVYLLGAGFSRAVSQHMPLLEDLGRAVAGAIREDQSLQGLLDRHETEAIDADRVPLGDVETWLTSLATDQPFLSASRNLRRRALFVELSALIAHQIRKSQHLASQRPWPQWFAGLLAHWRAHKNDVITLNYDTLIESASMTMHLREQDPEIRKELPLPNDIVGSFPPEPPQRGGFGEEVMSSFSLHKLHGSTNWYGHLGSADMLSIFRFDLMTPEWGGEDRRLNRAMTALRDSLQVLIFPPVADKSALYGNATMSAIWQRALAAITGAERLVVFGYSVPPTDTSMLALLATGTSPDTRITIVDPPPRQHHQSPPSAAATRHAGHRPAARG